MNYYYDLAPRLLSNVTDFPVQALGPVFMPAAVQVHMETGIAIETVAACALAVGHAAVQDLLDVQRPDCPPSPSGAVHLVVSAAGEGFERAIDPFLSPLRDFDSKIAQTLHDDRYRFQAEMKAWSAQERALSKRMNEAAENGDGLALFKAEYEELAAHRPAPVDGTPLIIDSPSAKSLTEGPWAESKPVLLFEPHVEDLLESRHGKFDRLISSIFGSVPRPSNAVPGGVPATGSRGSALFGAQPASYRKYLNRNIDSAAGSEVLGSMLTTWSHPTVGFCFQQTPPFPSTETAMSKVADRLNRLLARGQQRRVAGLPREALPFTDRAANEYRAIFNTYQQFSAPGSILNGTTGLASRAAEHVARKACMLHCIEGRTGAIDIEVLARANQIVQWFVYQNYFALSPGQIGDQREIDAQAVAEAFDRASANGLERVSRSELQQWCHSDMTAQRFRTAWHLLVQRKKLVVSHSGRMTYLSAAPALETTPKWPFPRGADI